MGYHLNFGAVWRSFDLLLSGLGLGLAMAIISIFAGCWIGLAAAFAMNSGHPAWRRIFSTCRLVDRVRFAEHRREWQTTFLQTLWIADDDRPSRQSGGGDRVE